MKSTQVRVRDECIEGDWISRCSLDHRIIAVFTMDFKRSFCRRIRSPAKGFLRNLQPTPPVRRRRHHHRRLRNTDSFSPSGRIHYHWVVSLCGRASVSFLEEWEMIIDASLSLFLRTLLLGFVDRWVEIGLAALEFLPRFLFRHTSIIRHLHGHFLASRLNIVRDHAKVISIEFQHSGAVNNQFEYALLLCFSFVKGSLFFPSTETSASISERRVGRNTNSVIRRTMRPCRARPVRPIRWTSRIGDLSASKQMIKSTLPISKPSSPIDVDTMTL